ncbi:hypothetical protein VNO77_14779 [Canavalia gladiata]|uniref:Uncharacterized protein n=1 Tax=Canavalia gladiata TaxID=3824 RepID=A0AAN9M387_CANGL
MALLRFKSAPRLSKEGVKIQWSLMDDADEIIMNVLPPHADVGEIDEALLCRLDMPVDLVPDVARSLLDFDVQMEKDLALPTLP